jgi:hypothetical protein
MTEMFALTSDKSRPARHFISINMLKLACTAALASLPLVALAHLLDGSPDPLPRWVPIAGLVIVGIMGGTVGFAISKHRASMEKKKKQILQRAAKAGAAQANESPPAETR